MNSKSREHTGEKFVMTFVREQQVLEEYTGSIEEYWYNIYDLFDESDLMVIRSSNGQPLTDDQTKKVLSLLAENMSDDGYPLIWRIHNGSLFLAEDFDATPFGITAYEQYKSLLPNDSLENIFGESTIKRFEKQIQKRKSPNAKRKKKFDFYGVLSKDVIEGKKPVYFRPRIEAMFDEVAKLKALSNWTLDCILALEPVIHDSPFVRDADLAELVGTLYDELSMDLDQKGSENKSFSEEPLVKEWLNSIDESHRARKSVFELKKGNGVLKVKIHDFTLHDIAMVLKGLKIQDSFLDWLRRSIVKLEEDKRLVQNPIIDQLAERQFEMLEDFAEDCFWCGEENIEPNHIEKCEKRNQLLLYKKS